MATEHTVVQGECLNSIAAHHGFTPDYLWGRPENADLKELRQDPNVLLAGDIVVIPNVRPKSVGVASGARHRFRVKNVPLKQSLVFLASGKPRAGVPYSLTVAGKTTEGALDGGGRVEWWTDPRDQDAAKLVLKPKDAPVEEYEVVARHLDPASEVSGMKARLKNLGFYDGAIDAQVDAAMRRAVKRFQKSRGLLATGTVDDDTREAIVAAHGS